VCVFHQVTKERDKEVTDDEEEDEEDKDKKKEEDEEGKVNKFIQIYKNASC